MINGQPTVEDLAKAIYHMEGDGPTTLATRNNNPGNLRTSIYSNGTNGGYATFPDMETGWQALYHQIQLDQDRGLSLRDFIYKYAPPSENNTVSYLNYLSSSLGIGVDSPLSSLLPNSGGNQGTGIDLGGGDTGGSDSGGDGGSNGGEDVGLGLPDIDTGIGPISYGGVDIQSILAGEIPQDTLKIIAIVGAAALIAMMLKPK